MFSLENLSVDAISFFKWSKLVVMDEQENAMELVTTMKMSCKDMMIMMTLLRSWVAYSLE